MFVVGLGLFGLSSGHAQATFSNAAQVVAVNTTPVRSPRRRGKVLGQQRQGAARRQFQHDRLMPVDVAG